MEFINSNANLVLGEDSGGKGRHFVSRFIEDGLVSYGDAGVLKVTKEALDKFSQTLVGCPVIIKHQEVNDGNADALRSGVISDVYFNADDGWYYCAGVIWDKEALQKIEEGWSVSCCYNMTDSTGDSGEWHNMHYDDELLNGVFEHLAIVPNPRYEEATILLNSKEKEYDMLFKLFNGKKSNEEKSEMVEKITESEAEEIKENEDEAEEEVKEEVENKRNDSESEDKEEEKEASDEDEKAEEEEENSDDEDEEKENEESEEEKENKCGRTKSNSKFDKLQKLHNSCNTEVKSGYVNEKARIALGDSLF